MLCPAEIMEAYRQTNVEPTKKQALESLLSFRQGSLWASMLLRGYLSNKLPCVVQKKGT